MMSVTTTGVLLGVILLLSSSNGYPMYQQQIPNGDHIPNPCNRSTIWPGVGHQNVYGSGPRNPFGMAFQANGHTWNRTLCMEDSDGDGRKNGEELGDPNCVWRPGATPSNTNPANLTHPGVCEPLDSHDCVMKNSWFNGCGPKKFDCPAINDSAVTSFVLRFPVTPIPDVETTNICHVFQISTNSTADIIAYEPIIGNPEILHHMIIVGCTGTPEHPVNSTYACGMSILQSCRSVIGGYAPGSAAGTCFNSEMGFRIGSNDFTYIILQLHWNNPMLKQNLTDSSGIKFYQTTNLRPNRGDILVVGQTYLEIPPGQQEVTFIGNCSSGCTNEWPRPIFITTTFLHMHLSGRSGEVALYRNGSRVYTFVVENNYDFNSPKFISPATAVEVKPGDQLYVKCVFSSIGRNHTTYMGEATSDEMCYAFFTYYPQIEGYLACVQWKTVELCGSTVDPKSLRSAFCDISSFLTLLAVTGYTCNESCTETTACRVVLYGMYETGCQNVLDVIEFAGILMPSYLDVYMRCAAVIPPPTTSAAPTTTTITQPSIVKPPSTSTRTTTPSSTATTIATTPKASSQSTMVQCLGDKPNRSPGLSMPAATVLMLWFICAIIKPF